LVVNALKREIADARWLREVEQRLAGNIIDVTAPMINLIKATETGSVQGWCPGADEAARPEPLSGLSAVLHAHGATSADLPVPEHEDEGGVLHKLYEGGEFVDDLSGKDLDKELAIKARLLELNFFRRHKVYTKVPKETWMRPISTKWLDVNKGDKSQPNYRSRLVGRELNLYKRDDLFAGTPPLESLRFVVSRCASNKQTTC